MTAFWTAGQNRTARGWVPLLVVHRCIFVRESIRDNRKNQSSGGSGRFHRLVGDYLFSYHVMSSLALCTSSPVFYIILVEKTNSVYHLGDIHELGVGVKSPIDSWLVPCLKRQIILYITVRVSQAAQTMQWSAVPSATTNWPRAGVLSGILHSSPAVEGMMLWYGLGRPGITSEIGNWSVFV